MMAMTALWQARVGPTMAMAAAATAVVAAKAAVATRAVEMIGKAAARMAAVRAVHHSSSNDMKRMS